MFKTVIQPRVSETDGSGHINNTTIPVWLEAGRQPLFQLFTPDLSFSNWKLVVVNTNIDYVAQLFYGQEAQVLTWIETIGNSSLVLHEEIHQGDRLCIEASTTYVNFDFSTQKAEPIPEDIRRELVAHLVEVS